MTTPSSMPTRTSSRSRRQPEPYEKVAVGKNRQYVVEAIRAEGDSEWRTCAHDEFALVMDGEVEIRLAKLGPDDLGPTSERGSNAIAGAPSGPSMGRVVARRGHMTLLPVGAAYQFHADRPGCDPAAEARRVRTLSTAGRRSSRPSRDSHRSEPPNASPRTLARRTTMSISAPSGTKSTEPNKHGYRVVQPRRVQVHAATSTSPTWTWPTGKHVMSVDAFLKALKRESPGNSSTAS